MIQAKPVFSKLPKIPKFSNSDLKQRYGSTGTENYSGYFTEEYNLDWRDERRVEIVERMRRGNGVISAILKAVKTPINSTEWYIQAASDDAKDIAIKEEVERQLFGMPQRGFRDFIRESLTHLDFGHAVFEKIWYQDSEGRLCLKDLAPRIQHSILRWLTNDGFPGITQYIRSDQQYETDREYVSSLSIPLSKLVIFTHEKEGNDLTGIPIIRPAYTHWYYADNLYKLQAISLERFGVGVIDIKHTQGVSDADKASMEELAENLYTNEKGYLLHSDAFTFDIKSPSSGSQEQFERAISHHNRMMMLSVLAEFLDLGSGNTGSFALSEDQSSFFLQHVGQIAEYMREVINREIIEDIVNFNFGVQENYPTIEYQALGNVNYKEMASVFKDLTAAGVLQTDPELYQFVRNLFQFPELSKEQMEIMDIGELETEINKIERSVKPEETEVEEEEEGIVEEE
jgi:hypothetical protein